MSTFAGAALVLCTVLPAGVAAQKVVIKGATPSDVVRAVNTELASQGFKLEDSTKSEARFALERGLVNQTTSNGVQSVPVVLELYLRFKQKSDGGGSKSRRTRRSWARAGREAWSFASRCARARKSTACSNCWI